jgi:flagellar hook-basal body complex protein FliE
MAIDDLKIEALSRQHLVPGLDASGVGQAGRALSDAEILQEARRQGLEVPNTRDVATTFSDVLRQSVDKVNEYQHQADSAIKELVAGRSKNIHETMLAIERADTSLKLMMQVRNKMLDAYKEIMRMQV